MITQLHETTAYHTRVIAELQEKNSSLEQDLHDLTSYCRSLLELYSKPSQLWHHPFGACALLCIAHGLQINKLITVIPGIPDTVKQFLIRTLQGALYANALNSGIAFFLDATFVHNSWVFIGIFIGLDCTSLAVNAISEKYIPAKEKKGTPFFKKLPPYFQRHAHSITMGGIYLFTMALCNFLRK